MPTTPPDRRAHIGQLAWSPAQFAHLTGRAPSIIYKWIQRGQIKAVKRNGGALVIPRAEGLRFLGMTEEDLK